MAYDFKKEYKSLYLPKHKPSIIEVPAMTFVAVAGEGDPNEGSGAYQIALNLPYSFSYTVKMSKKGDWQPDGYFDFVVPPLEGFWWSEVGVFDGSHVGDKSAFRWVSLIRQPDFVTLEDFERICQMMMQKKPELVGEIESGKLRLIRFSEGLCAQVMHKGAYDDEPATIADLAEFIECQGLQSDIASADGLEPEAVLDALDCAGNVPTIRLHHEIYLGDPRRTKPESLKTVIRQPVIAMFEEGD